MNEYNIFDIGYNTNLSRNDLSAALPDFQANVQPASSGGLGTYAGGITDFTNIVSSPQTLQSGALGSTVNQSYGALFNAKVSFSDTTAGYRLGVDISDNELKFIIGDGSSSMDWNVTTPDTLTINGALSATSGSVGGFTLGSDFIRDAANSFGLASTVTGGDDVRFWAGDTFANRATAPFRITESGVGVIGGFTLSSTALTATNAGNQTIVSSGSTAFSAGPTGSPTVTITQAGAITATSISTFSGTTTILNPNITNASVLAGESLTAGNAVCLVNDLHQEVQGSTVLLGSAAGTTRQAVRFISRTTITSSSIKIFIRKIGAPVDNVTIEVQGNTSDDPNDTPITNGTSNNVTGGSLTTSFVETTFTFASAFTITAGTTYWLVFKRSGSTDGANHYVIETAVTTYGSFASNTFDGSAWGTAGTAPAYFQMTLATGTPSITLWKTDADVVGLRPLYGFSTASYSAGDSATITVVGVNANQSGLTKGATYYLSSTAGAITTTPVTGGGGAIGIAVSATEILITAPEPVASTGQISRANADGTTNQIIAHNLGRIPKLILINASQDLGTALGICNGTAVSPSSQSCAGGVVSGAGAQSMASSSNIIFMSDVGGGGGATGTAALLAVSSTTFTLDWTTAASGSGAVVFNWTASA